MGKATGGSIGRLQNGGRSVGEGQPPLETLSHEDSGGHITPFKQRPTPRRTVCVPGTPSPPSCSTQAHSPS